MKRVRKYKFTNKEYSFKSILSTIFGAISIASMVAVVLFSFQNGGEARIQYGLSAILALILSVTGLITGILSRTEKDKYYLFANCGIVLNILSLVVLCLFLVLGINS